MGTNILTAKALRALGLSTGLILALTAGLPETVLALPSRNPAQESQHNVADKIAQIGLSQDFRLFKADFFQGFGVRGGYHYKVEPSFKDGLFTRSDQYYFNLDMSGSDSFGPAGSADFGIGLSLNNDVEVKFSRQFKDSVQAELAAPYFYKNLPFDYERAIKGMKVGDYFSMKTNMGVVVSGNLLRSMGAHFALDVNAHYLVSGAFQVHALRLPNDQVRLKLVGLHGKGKGIDAGIGCSGVLEIFKIGYFDRRLTKIMDLDPIKISVGNGINDLFMVDYVIDFKDEETQQAYNSVLRSATDLRELLKTVKPGRSPIERLKNSLIMDIEPLDKISRTDVENHVEKKRVARSFKGSMDSKNSGWTFKVGFRLFRYNASKNYSENQIVSVMDNETKQYYQLNSFNARSESELFWSWSDTREDVKMNAVIRTDSNFKNPVFDDLVIATELRDKRFRSGEFRDLKVQFSRTLPKIISSLIDFTPWHNEAKKNTVFVQRQIVFHPEVLDAAPELSYGEIYSRYMEYLDKLNDENRFVSVSGSEGTTMEEKFGLNVQSMAGRLAVALDKKQDNITRMKALMDLRNDPFFLKTGIRFFIELLPQEIEKLKELIYIDIKIESGDGDKVPFVFGNRKESEIYNRLLLIQSIINDDGLDLRLESETLSSSLQ